MVRVYGIVFKDKETEYIPIRNDNPKKPWQFENEPMQVVTDTLIDDMEPLDLLGIVSYAFRIKTGLSKIRVHTYIKESPKADVYNFCRKHGTRQNPVHFMDWSEQGHPGIKDFIQRCCKHVGMVYTNDPKHVVYANQFVASKHVYVSYMNEVIKPCLELLEGPMWEEVNRDPSYTKAKPGVAYTFIPFVLERMMNQFIFNRKLICNDYYKRP